jgi:aminoglycoside 3-N-acetyltransferase
MTPSGGTGGHDRASLTDDLLRLGLRPGTDVLVHCSMRRIGALTAGPKSLLTALREVIGEAATLVVPTQTADNSTTSPAYHEATQGMTTDERAAFEERIEAFDPLTTPSRGMGTLAEHVRQQPEAVRSGHPQASFAAIGPAAASMMEVHDLDSHLGERSPLSALYQADATVLLLGVGYEACTALHLAEYRLPRPPPIRPYRCYVLEDGRRVRRDFHAPHLDASDFGALGQALDDQAFVRSHQVGDALAKVMPIRDAVDFAVVWLARHRHR